MDRFGELFRLYDGYVASYRSPDGSLPEMMALKRRHTDEVVRNAEAIAAGEGFSPLVVFAARAAALLHDTGRYEQLRRYNTFRDSDSVDHAVFSHDIVAEKGWLAAVCVDPATADAILKAVLYHNRRDLPPELAGGDLPSDLALLRDVAHTVRDADKLDIFRVLENLVATTDWRRDRTAFWNLSPDDGPNPEVVKAIAERRPVDYQHIRSLADFVLIQVGWMVSGLYFRTSRRICRDRGHLAFRRRFLGEIGAGKAADEVCDLAARSLG